MKLSHLVVTSAFPLTLTLATLTSCSETKDGAKTSAPTIAAAPEPSSRDREREIVPTPARDPSANAPRYVVPLAGLPSYGPKDAWVTVVEVTDYECPYCRKAERTLETLRETYREDVRVVVLEYPLPMHERAEATALAALAVDASGRFESMHHALFESPERRTDEGLLELAVRSGVPRRAYESALASPAPRARLEEAKKLAKDLGVTGTPAFFVNGRKISGAQPLGTFDAMIREEIVHAKALVASGVPKASLYDAIVDEAHKFPAPRESLDPDAEPPSHVPAAKGIGGPLVRGEASAKTTMVVFTDLECPYCRKLDARLDEIVARHADVKVVLRHAPLPMHEHAELAAKAAIAAEKQEKLAAFVKLVFASQGPLERPTLDALARAAGLDMARFARDLDSPEVAARLEEDRALARKLDVRGTPTTFVESERVVGAQPLEAFEKALTKR
jgi:protein-disulfide isomerase